MSVSVQIAAKLARSGANPIHCLNICLVAAAYLVTGGKISRDLAIESFKGALNLCDEAVTGERKIH